MRRPRCMTQKDLISANCRTKYIQTNKANQPQVIKPGLIKTLINLNEFLINILVPEK
jgi:hypothetical protein